VLALLLLQPEQQLELLQAQEPLRELAQQLEPVKQAAVVPGQQLQVPEPVVAEQPGRYPSSCSQTWQSS